MKKYILPLAALSTLAYADMSVQEFVYKDPRIMGAGGANTAIGGYSTAVFYNPAGLINIKKSHGVEIELLGLSVTGSKKIQDFIEDVDNSDETDIVDTIKKYSGKTFNANVSNYTSASYHGDNTYAFSIGVLGSTDINMIPHANDGINGLLEVHGRAYGGVVLGGAKELQTPYGAVVIGLSGKYITQKSYDAALTEPEIVLNKDDLATYLQDNYEKSNSGFGVDLGVLYKLPVAKEWQPTIGLSVLNAGSLNFGGVYGSVPMTVNAGVSVTKEIPIFNRIMIGVDYVDILGAKQALVRHVNPVDYYDQYKTIDANEDIMNSLRAGITLDMFDNSWVMGTLSAGWYQDDYTAGIDLQLTILKIQAATYRENVGTADNIIEDRRYVVGLGIGW